MIFEQDGSHLTDWLFNLGTKYISLPGWLLSWSQLTDQLFPFLLLSTAVHTWMSLYIEVYTAAAVPAG